MTDEERAAMASLSTERVRRNYWLCEEQIKMCVGRRDFDAAATRLRQWQDSYLDELVQRGERI